MIFRAPKVETAKTGIASELRWLTAQSASPNCGDIGGQSLNDDLCLMPQRHNQAGLITYKDGRVVDIIGLDEKGRLTILSADGKNEIVLDGVDETSLDLTLEMQGTKIADCYGEARDASWLTPTRPLYILHDPQGTSPIAYGPEFVAELRNRVAGREADVFHCANRENAGEVGVRMKRSDIVLRAALAGLMAPESSSRSPLLDSLRIFQEADLAELDRRFCDSIPANSPHKSALCATR